MSETVHVTTDHIRCGQPGVASSCPIALALREQHSGLNVDVYNDDVIMANDTRGVFMYGALPMKAVQFVSDFDRAAPVRPFKFTIEWADHYPAEDIRAAS